MDIACRNRGYLDRQRLVSYFRSVLMTKVKTYMAKTMRQNAINIFEIDELKASNDKAMIIRERNFLLDERNITCKKSN